MAYKESYAGRINRKLNKKLHVVEVAAGRQKADLVLKNATYVNVFCNQLSRGDIAVASGLIAGMGEHYEGEIEVDMSGKLVLPGFVDAHIHLESSLVSPKEFAKAVLPHGTTTVITDPHEIANVMGTDGIEYMLQATEDLPLDVRFMLPSCVPATPLDESGANLDYRAIDSFYEHNRVEGLAEMMNYVGVANADEQVLEKIVAAQAHHKKIDGHAPGLSGNDLNAYVAAGVYSDHECSDMGDALAKLERGQYIMIREGTAARNLDALLPLLTPQYYTYCMFCTDDKHPNDLLEKGHIDYIIKKAIAAGVDPSSPSSARAIMLPATSCSTTAAPSRPASLPTSLSSITSATSIFSRSTRRASSCSTAKRSRPLRLPRSTRISSSAPTRPSTSRTSPPTISPRPARAPCSAWSRARS